MKRNHTKKASPVSGTFGVPRYSNYDPYAAPIGPSMEDGSFTYNNGSSSSGLGTDTSGSGFLSQIPGLVNTLGSVVTSIWGTSDNTRAEMWSNMYAQEKRTTNVLIGIVVALVLLAFVFLIIKKK